MSRSGINNDALMNAPNSEKQEMQGPGAGTLRLALNATVLAVIFGLRQEIGFAL